MNYNTTLFGDKRSIIQDNVSYTNPSTEESFVENIRLFDIATQNISMQQAYLSGDFAINDDVPRDIALWEIGEESILTKLSWIYKSNDVNYQVDTSNKKRVPLVLTLQECKCNSTTFDIASSGTIYTPTSQNNYRGLNSANNMTPNTTYPLWYLQAPVLQGNNPHHNTQPFILDFNYAGVLVEIWVQSGVVQIPLKNFMENSNDGTNKIERVLLKFKYGNEIVKTEMGSQAHPDGATGTYNMRNANILNIKRYDTPSYITVENNYPLPDFILANALGLQSYITGFFTLMDSSVPFSTKRVRYYLDQNYWDFTGLIAHGNDGEYTQDDFDYILKQVALLGFWFTTEAVTNNARITGENCYNVNTYLPEIKDGITTGRYWAGREAANQEAAKWGDDWREQVNYQPDGGGSSEENDESSRAVYETTLPSFGNIYFRDLNMVKYLAEDLNELITDTQNPYDPSIFYGQNPVDCIIAIKEYPIDITPYIVYAGSPNPQTLMNIKLGRWDSNTFAYRVQIKTGGEPFAQVSLSIPNSFKTIGYEFLDYEPYSTYHLYLPFCGTIKIPSELAVETNIEVLYYADILSGACIAHIYINNKYYCSAQGQLAVDIPFSGYQVSQYTMNMLNASYAQKQAYANLASDVGRLITGSGGSVIGMGINSKVGYGSNNPITVTNPLNPVDVLFSGTAGGIVNAGQVLSGAGKAIQAGAAMASHYETIKYNKTILNHSAPAPIKSSLGGGIINWESPYYVEMLVERPTFMQGFDSNKYTQLVGKACHIADTLANHSGGYVEAINCNLSGFPATQPEKVELAKLLADGVFL